MPEHASPAGRPAIEGTALVVLVVSLRPLAIRIFKALDKESSMSDEVPDPRDMKVYSRWTAFDPNGKNLGVVLLSNDRKRQFEAKGYTFKRARSDFQGR
jgi:hypothetical protein